MGGPGGVVGWDMSSFLRKWGAGHVGANQHTPCERRASSPDRYLHKEVTEIIDRFVYSDPAIDLARYQLTKPDGLRGSSQVPPGGCLPTIRLASSQRRGSGRWLDSSRSLERPLGQPSGPYGIAGRTTAVNGQFVHRNVATHSDASPLNWWLTGPADRRQG